MIDPHGLAIKIPQPGIPVNPPGEGNQSISVPPVELFGGMKIVGCSCPNPGEGEKIKGAHLNNEGGYACICEYERCENGEFIHFNRDGQLITKIPGDEFPNDDDLNIEIDDF